MIIQHVIRRALRGASAWRVFDAEQVATIARARRVQRIAKQLRELGHHQIAAMLERDEANGYAARNIRGVK